MDIDPDLSVDEIMRRWPAAIGVFLQWQMLCVGCPIGMFHTVGDACEAHDIAEGTFSRDLASAVHGQDSGK